MRPEEPHDDRTLPPPADPWATIDRPAATVYLSGPDTTAHVGPSDPAAHPPGPANAPTLNVGPPGPAAHPPGPANARTGYPPGISNAPTVRQDGSAPTVHAGGELRFGPGVPVPPVGSPAWPPTPAAKRPRWRRLVSLLSGLLTLALLVAVGLYLWQRFRPLAVQSVTVAVPRPAGNRCDVTVDVVATVHTNGRRGMIRYQWFRSDAPPGAVLTEQVGSGQRTAALTLKWTFNGVGTTTETATVNIIDPSPLQAGTRVAYRCRRG